MKTLLTYVIMFLGFVASFLEIRPTPVVSVPVIMTSD
jgi:hypothetical protein